MSIYSIVDYLGKTTYKSEEVIDVFKEVKIPDEYYDLKYYDELIVKEHERWDRLANRYYGSPSLWWLIASYNGFIDPFSQLNAGVTIKIIKPEFVPNLLLIMKDYIK